MREAKISLQVRLLAMRHRASLKGATLIAVAGDLDTDVTAQYLEGILNEAGKAAAVIRLLGGESSINSLRNLVDQVSLLRSRGKTHLIIPLHATDKGELEAMRAVVLDSLVLLPGKYDSKPLYDLGARHVVVPSSQRQADTSVQPFQHITYGEENEADAKIDTITLYRKGSEVILTIDHQTKLEIATHLTGYANAYCLIAAVAAAYVSGAALEAMQEGVADIQPPVERFEYHQAKQYDIVIERSSSDIAIEYAIKSAKVLAKRRLIVAIADKPNETILELLRVDAERVFFVSEVDDESLRFGDLAATPDQAIEKATRAAKVGDIVLLLGSTFSRETVFETVHVADIAS